MRIVSFDTSYAGAISNIVIRNLIDVNTADYDLEEMQEMSKGFQPNDIVNLAKSRQTFVAVENGVVLGTGSISNEDSGDRNDYWVLTVFIDPKQHRRGIGRYIMENLEVKAKAQGCQRLILPSSLTSHLFYRKLGFNYMGGEAIPNDKKQYMMEKIL